MGALLDDDDNDPGYGPVGGMCPIECPSCYLARMH